MAKVLPLARVDDLLAVRKCGYDSIETNITITTLIELKNWEVKSFLSWYENTYMDTKLEKYLKQCTV